MDFAIEKIEELANLKLTDEERKDLQKDLERILEFVSIIQEVDTSNISPLRHPLGVSLFLHEDKEETSLDRDSLEKIAPRMEGGFWIVPRVIPQE